MPADPEPPLALLLLRAGRWFDRRVIDGLERRGWPRVTPAQTLAFAHLDTEGTPPAELARRLGTTRQSTADLIAVLTRMDLVHVRDDPDRARGRLIHLTDRGHDLATDARDILRHEEQRLHKPDVARLRSALIQLDLSG